MINRYRETEDDQQIRRVVGNTLFRMGLISLVVFSLALAAAAAPAYAQDPTPVPPIVITLYAPTPEPTMTPTPLPTVDPASVGYAGPGNAVDWSVDNVVTWTTQDWDFGCPFSYNTEATGPVAICIVYTQITGWSMIGVDIPFWPFTGALALIIVGWLVRR